MNTYTTGRIDFHCHMLPAIDDGSSGMDESCAMAALSAGDGVSVLIMTPHFYAGSDDPERFFARRDAALAQFRAALPPDSPTILPGAEVLYFEGLSGMDALPRMRIGNSRALLVEMPFCRWPQHVINDIIQLNDGIEYQVVLAHIERYLDYQKKSTLEAFLDAGVLFQSNCEFFTDSGTRRKALRMLKKGMIHLLGTDCHNLTTRRPNMADACRIIGDKFGEEAEQMLMSRAARLLADQTE